ncbi:hypothetical protein BDR26DRAFT_457329 [Obelidium mucronatum]|nr:hypothetical protein BDR26DRAFT_457329 [Obelidium mucronatum]
MRDAAELIGAEHGKDGKLWLPHSLKYVEAKGRILNTHSLSCCHCSNSGTKRNTERQELQPPVLNPPINSSNPEHIPPPVPLHDKRPASDDTTEPSSNKRHQQQPLHQYDDIQTFKHVLEKYLASHTTTLEIIAAKLGIPISVNPLITENTLTNAADLNERLLAAIGERLIEDAVTIESTSECPIDLPKSLEPLYRALEAKLEHLFASTNTTTALSKSDLHKRLNPFESRRSFIRVSGREWLVDKIMDWWNNPDSSNVFWLCGEAGCGKSTMVDVVISKFKTTVDLPNPLSFYFNHTADLDSVRVVKTLAFELAQNHASVSDAIRKHSDMWFGSQGPKNPPTLYEIFSTLIAEPLGDTPLLICIDALDECDPTKRNDLLELIGSNLLPPSIRFLVTSRPGDLDLYDHLSESEIQKFDSSSGNNRLDLEAFARSRLKGLKFLAGNPNLDLWMQQIVDKCNGSFLALVVAFETIIPRSMRSGGPTKPRNTVEFVARFEETLASELGIDDLYGSILNRVMQHHQAGSGDASFSTSVLELLSLILCLKSPLDIDSVSYFLSLDIDSVRDQLSWISPLLKPYDGIGSSKLEIKHKTVYEYLSKDTALVKKLNMSQADAKITEKCLQVLVDTKVLKLLTLQLNESQMYRVFVNAVAAPPDLSVAGVPDSSFRYILMHGISHFSAEPVGGGGGEDVARFVSLYPVSGLLAANNTR